MFKRSAGILIPLFSLRTADDLGRGDIGGLTAMLPLALAMGQRLIQLLPLDEIGPGEASPYSAMSVMALDPMYIAAGGLPGVSKQALDAARAKVRAGRVANRQRFRQAKLELLSMAFDWFIERGTSAEQEEFGSYQDRNADWLADYALFRALKDRFEWRAWETWPEGLRDRDSAVLDAARRELAHEVARYAYWQFIAHRQMAAARAGFAVHGAFLGGDLAFSPGRDSAEVWSHQAQFDLNRLVGAPPDGFSPDGQRWGLPMPNWERMRAEGWPLLRMRLRRARELYDVIRIDHVVGLFRTFNFSSDPGEPGCFTPAGEEQQREQGESIMRAIIEEAGESSIIAEDLGAVPQWVRDSLTALGIPGYRVMRWEKDIGRDGIERFVNPAHYPELSVATTGTHDTETLVAWWRGSPAEERRILVESLGLLGRIDPESPRLGIGELDAFFEVLYAAPSALVIEPIQDLFGWADQINYPGTVSPANWSYRLPRPIERMLESPATMRRAAAIRAIACRTNRFDG